MTSGCRGMYGTPWALYDSIAIPTGNTIATTAIKCVSLSGAQK